MAKKQVEVDERVVKIQTQMDNIVEDIRSIDLKKAELEALLDAKIQILKGNFNQKIDGLNSKRDYLITEIKTLFEQVPQSVTKTQRKVSLLNGDVVVKNATQKIDYDKKSLLDFAEANVNSYLKRKGELEGLIERIDIQLAELNTIGFDPIVGQTIDDLFKERNKLQEELNELLCPWIPLIKKKTVADFDWATYKEKLEITNINVIDEETGEVVGEKAIIRNMETGEVVDIGGLMIVDVDESIVIK